MEEEKQQEEYEEAVEDMSEETQEKQFEDNLDLNDEYDSPVPDERQNQHSFLHKATFGDGTESIKTTFLEKEELGRPVFPIRFLMDMETIAHYYLDALSFEIMKNNDSNYVARYFRNKILNITDSGMSNEGFTMNLNVTQKRDISRKRFKGNIENLKGRSNNDGKKR